jgi:hypothetical protein
MEEKVPVLILLFFALVHLYLLLTVIHPLLSFHLLIVLPPCLVLLIRPGPNK